MNKDKTNKANIIFRWSVLMAAIVILFTIVIVVVRQLLGNESVQEKLMQIIYDHYQVIFVIIFWEFGIKTAWKVLK